MMKLNGLVAGALATGLVFGLIASANAAEITTSDYAEALPLAVKFFGAQRSGDNHNWLLARNPAGSTCHLGDGEAYASGYDLTGGWMDAGDFLKFTQNNAFTAHSLLKAYEVWPDAFADLDDIAYSGVPNGIPDILDEVKIATDYLLKVMPDDDTVIARVGGNQDHDNLYTCPTMSALPAEQGGDPRPVYADGKANTAGIAAAALALMSKLYMPYDADYAAAALAQAKRLDAFAKAHPGTVADGYYPEGVCETPEGEDVTYDEDYYENGRCAANWTDGEYRDAEMCGAIELYRATGETTYFDRASALSAELDDHGWVVGWGQNEDYCRHSLALAGDEAAIALLKTANDRAIDLVSDSPNVKGLAYYMPWGSLNSALSAAFSAALTFELTGEEKYRDFAVSQVDYALGQNEYDRSFIVGWGHNPPQHPHHANTLGVDDGDWEKFSNETPMAYELTGAMVGGPTEEAEDVTKAGYEDDIADYIGNEVTIYYNSALVGALAFAASSSAP
ncbi:glycoside hydrolase family 9 protein [Cucumibacter marinus]|uniref:glycoside hydrolase family 9 protein n=1 Tax=Cucumibacter marinus TaxID=1121252 RepID=UPI00138ABCB5|nr:glycoside hydrolase family 9 protein [Cucumibacter marinus]